MEILVVFQMVIAHTEGSVIARLQQKPWQSWAINAPLQGTAADIIKRAMIVIDEELKNWGTEELKKNSSIPQFLSSSVQLPARLLLQIHDELIIECDVDKAEAVSARCKKILEQVIQLSVPLIADANIGQSWAEIH